MTNLVGKRIVSFNALAVVDNSRTYSEEVLLEESKKVADALQSLGYSLFDIESTVSEELTQEDVEFIELMNRQPRASEVN